MPYGDFKDLASRAASEKFLRDKAFNIAKNPRYDGYHGGLASMLYSCFDKKTSGRRTKSISNQQLPNDLRNPIIKIFKKEVFAFHLKTIFGVLV